MFIELAHLRWAPSIDGPRAVVAGSFLGLDVCRRRGLGLAVDQAVGRGLVVPLWVVVGRGVMEVRVRGL
jgi:hypothetical protein